MNEKKERTFLKGEKMKDLRWRLGHVESRGAALTALSRGSGWQHVVQFYKLVAQRVYVALQTCGVAQGRAERSISVVYRYYVSRLVRRLPLRIGN
jgi:hypothetical protein